MSSSGGLGSDNELPTVLSRQSPLSSSTANSAAVTTTMTTTTTATIMPVTVVTTCDGTIMGSADGDASSKTTTTIPTTSGCLQSTIVSSDGPTPPSSGKCIGTENKKTTSINAGTVTAPISNTFEPASSSSSSPCQQTPKNRRKPSSRIRKDSGERNKASAASANTGGMQMVPQAPLMLTSAPPGQFMLVHHNGQCYMMSATQYFGANQQIATVRPQQQQPQPQVPQQFSPSTISCTSDNSNTTTITTTTSTTSAQDFLKAMHQQQVQPNQASTCNALAAVQQFYSQQQYRHAHQQQYVQQGIVANSATLGQLARSLAPKPALIGPASAPTSSVPATAAQMSPVSTATVTASTSKVVGHGSDASGTRPTQHQPTQQLCATPVQQIHSSMFSQGIQLRTPQGSSGIVFQMPSGSYTYVHQLVTPQQRSSTAIPQLQQIPACIGQTVATSQSQNQQQQQQPVAANSVTQKITVATTSQSKSKTPVVNNNVPKRESSVVEQSNENTSSNTIKENQSFSQAASSPSQLPTNSAKGNEVQSKCAKGGGKHAGSGRKAVNSAIKIATPQPIAPTNLVPVGAPVPMMVMSTAVPQISSFTGPTTVPFMGPNGQIIHQQLITNSPVPTHQMIPVFQQQRQNTAHFAVPQPPPAPIPEANSQDLQKPVTEDDNGFADSGIENEPPPLLVQGESKDALDIHMLFTREAERYYQKAGRKGKIVHLIEGFEIEESDEPFPCEPPCRLSDWLLSEVEDKETTKSEEVVQNTSPKKATDEKDKVESNVEKSDIRRGRAKISPTKSEVSNETKEKKTRKRKTNELDRLLQMDFGPSHGRLSDILQKSSVYIPTKENKDAPKSSAKSKGRPPTSSTENPKVENVEMNEPVMERFIIEDAIESPPKIVPKKCEESSVIADHSLNSSKSSGETLTGSLLASFSDEELDTERCNYCNGLLRLKRLENHPQYCSKKCRKLWKRNPPLSEEQVVRSFNASPRLSSIRSTDVSPISKDVSPTVPVLNVSVIPEPSISAVTNELQQRSPPILTLKMVSPQQAEIVKSPRSVSTSQAQAEGIKIPSASLSPTLRPEKTPTDFLSRATKTWTCDEVASWVISVTGNEDCANTFRNQDIDGQSLLLLADNAHHNLGTLLGLKLGPVVKILNALKELCAKSINAM